MRREVGSPASCASTIWLAAQIRISASQMVAIPCSGVASTWIETSPMRNRIGATRLLLASEKKGQLIRSWASRGAISPAIGRNRSSCREVKPLAVTDYRPRPAFAGLRSEEHTSELQSLMRISYAVFCLKKKKNTNTQHTIHIRHTK